MNRRDCVQKGGLFHVLSSLRGHDRGFDSRDVRVDYLNTYTADHVYFSQPRAWMALVMGAVMLGFMLNMYKNRRAN
ncbi:MAG: hypothetical protein LH466_04015, partial [Sphingomonas bacterium]|nr:hypothetical protein [Sphingomonas bacterium]